MKYPTFMENLNKCITVSWQSKGSIACKINQVKDGSFEVMFFPALREVYGGKEDGKNVFAGFNFNVGKFVQVFDTSPPPLVWFDCVRKGYIDHLIFKGSIDKVIVKIAVLSTPPDGQRAVERIYTNGPKKGTVEKITR